MANSDSASGFLAVGNMGSNYVPPVQRVAFAAGDSVAAYRGSLVKLTGAVDADGVTPVVELADPSDTKIVGAIQWFEPQRGGDWTIYYREASTRTYAYVPRDPNQVYQVQEDSDGGNIDPATSIGLNVDFTAESGNTSSGLSTMELDSSTVANTAALPIRLIQPVDRQDNDPTSTSANGVWLVTINQDDLRNTTGT